MPSGHILVETGVDYSSGCSIRRRACTGNLWRIGTFGFSFGVSSIAEIQLDGGVRNHLSITKFEPAPLSSMLTVTGDTTGDFEDITIGTKVRFMTETAGRPAMAVRFWTRLPNASNESGLGLDTTDFNFDVNDRQDRAVDARRRQLRVRDPRRSGARRQPERRAQLRRLAGAGDAAGVEIVCEINGRREHAIRRRRRSARRRDR